MFIEFESGFWVLQVEYSGFIGCAGILWAIYGQKATNILIIHYSSRHSLKLTLT